MDDVGDEEAHKPDVMSRTKAWAMRSAGETVAVNICVSNCK